MESMDQQTKNRLHNQLIKLGDMMGDGLHLEPDGKWIEKEYRQIAKALGFIPKKKNNSTAINERMMQRVKEVQCGKCQGQLSQTRQGSKRAQCTQCGAKRQLLK